MFSLAGSSPQAPTPSSRGSGTPHSAQSNYSTHSLAFRTEEFVDAASGNLLLIYVWNFHVLSHLLLIYICKLHWNCGAADHVFSPPRFMLDQFYNLAGSADFVSPTRERMASQIR